MTNDDFKNVVCPVCGGPLLGDGVTTALHCEFADDEDLDGVEPDASPVYCRDAGRVVICPECNGSGEGRYDGAICKRCRGYGEVLDD